ncbi:MAG: phosphatidate cytidylyltransferase [Opitutaceae bacterium]|nr:phosphatidate cytidylyltransferase [Cytophagales bacterium]
MVLVSMSFLLTSCAVVGGIFKTGFYAGIFVVIAVVGLILYFIMRSKSNNNTNT